MHLLERFPRAFQRLRDTAVHRTQSPVLRDELDGVRVSVEFIAMASVSSVGVDTSSILRVLGLYQYTEDPLFWGGVQALSTRR